MVFFIDVTGVTEQDRYGRKIEDGVLYRCDRVTEQDRRERKVEDGVLYRCDRGDGARQV